VVRGVNDSCVLSLFYDCFWVWTRTSGSSRWLAGYGFCFSRVLYHKGKSRCSTWMTLIQYTPKQPLGASSMYICRRPLLCSVVHVVRWFVSCTPLAILHACYFVVDRGDKRRKCLVCWELLAGGFSHLWKWSWGTFAVCRYACPWCCVSCAIVGIKAIQVTWASFS
jgi:hypothetical protein